MFSINSGTSGSVQFPGLSSGYYILRVEARNRERLAERLVIRKLLEVVSKFTCRSSSMLCILLLQFCYNINIIILF